MVSTDDQEIKEICLSNGLHVHERDSKLGQDRSTVVEVMLDLLKKFDCDNFCCVYPTSCLLEPAIFETLDRFMGDNSIDVLMGTSKYNYHPVQALVLKENGLASPLLPSFQNTVTISILKFELVMVHFIGPVWIHLQKKKTFYSKKLGLFDVPPSQVCDINTIEDFLKVKTILET